MKKIVGVIVEIWQLNNFEGFKAVYNNLSWHRLSQSKSGSPKSRNNSEILTESIGYSGSISPKNIKLPTAARIESGITAQKKKSKMEKLNEAILEKTKEEIGMGATNAKDDIITILNWVNHQPHLPTLKDDEETSRWLYNYLFYCKNNIEKVKKHLDTYFTCKSLLPEFYENRDPEGPEIKANVKALYLITLPKLTLEGYRVHIFCHAEQDANAYEPKDFMRRALMMCDWKMKNDLTGGDIIIFHLKYSSLAHWSRYNLVTLSRFVAAVTNAYALRIKAIHFTQAPSFISQTMNNLFASMKLKKRIHIHKTGNIVELLKDVPKDCLPVELGGTLDITMDELNESTYKNIVEMKEWFKANESMKSIESRRLLPLKDNALFGCEGTFRNLSID